MKRPKPKPKLIDIAKEPPHANAGLVTCYAAGRPFRKEKGGFRVEEGKQRLVNRALCVVQYHGRKCRICPNGGARLTFRPLP